MLRATTCLLYGAGIGIPKALCVQEDGLQTSQRDFRDRSCREAARPHEDGGGAAHLERGNPAYRFCDPPRGSV